MYEMNVGDGHEWKRLVKCDAFAKCSYAKNVTIFLYVHFDLAYFFRNKDFWFYVSDVVKNNYKCLTTQTS